MGPTILMDKFYELLQAQPLHPSYSGTIMRELISQQAKGARVVIYVLRLETHP